MTADRRFRVLHVGKYYPPYMGGIETHLQTLCGAIRNDVDVDVVVANNRHETVDEIVDGIHVSRLATTLSVSAAPVYPGLIGHLRRSTADIVHLHLPNPFAVIAYLASGHTGTLVITYHGDIVGRRLLMPAFEPLFHRAFRRASAIIVSTERYLETSAILQRHRDRCRVIPYGIDVDRFMRADESGVAAIRQRYGRRIVLAVGRLTYYKGFDWLIRAMATVKGTLLIVGDGRLRKRLQSIARSCGVDDRVVLLTGVRDREIVSYYHAADLFALPSTGRSESFGIVQIEAMASGRPVVNTSLDSGVPFISLDRVTGLTVPPRDAGALAAAVTTLLDDPGLRAVYGEAGKRRAREEFSVGMMAQRTLDLYREVATQG